MKLLLAILILITPLLLWGQTDSITRTSIYPKIWEYKILHWAELTTRYPNPDGKSNISIRVPFSPEKIKSGVILLIDSNNLLNRISQFEDSIEIYTAYFSCGFLRYQESHPRRSYDAIEMNMRREGSLQTLLISTKDLVIEYLFSGKGVLTDRRIFK